MDVRLPDGTIIRGVPDGTSRADLVAKLAANGYDVSKLQEPAASTPKPEAGGETVPHGPRELGQAVLGAVRGAADIGDTIINAAAHVVPSQALKDWNAERRASLADFDAERAKDTGLAYQAGRIAGNVAGTAGVGGVLAAPLRAIPALAPIAEAVATSGMRAGGATGLPGMAARIVGGAAIGGASAALVDPQSAGTGAAIGAALPPALAAAGKVGTAAYRTVRGAIEPQSAKLARVVAEAAGDSPQALAEQLRPVGPQLIPESLPTAAELIQSPGVSQLQRVVKASGSEALAEREQANALARMNALQRISSVSGTPQQAAETFGNALERFAIPAEATASRNVSNAYDAVDPFLETAFRLPLDEMQAARAKYLGPGTFGSGRAAGDAIRTAEDIGTMELPGVAMARAPRVESLLDAVKRAGGITENSFSSRALGGELRDLRQAGIGRVVYKDRGLTLDRMAEKMHEAGFIHDEDPATLIDALRGHAYGTKAGDVVHAAGDDLDALYRAQAEAAMGEAPAAERIARPVTFREVQNLRSSIGEAADSAAANGRNREAAALRQMVGDIDARVNRVAAGQGEADELFPPDVVEQWRKANSLHAGKMERFHTGPQQSMFRRGGDGQPAAQGAELAGKFFNAARSQADDARAFKRLVGENADLPALLKNYAITDAAGQTNALGALTNTRFNRWLDARSGAVGELFDPGEQALLKAIGDDLARADLAENLGRATGSNTFQNAQSALRLGLLDHPLTGIAANRIPIIGNFTGPALSALREAGRKSRAQALGELLANPEELAQALTALDRPNALGALVAHGARGSAPLAYRSAPLLSSDR